MKQTINKLLGRTTAASSSAQAGTPRPAAKQAAKPVPKESRDSQHTIEDNSDNGTRRQLVQVLLRDCLRRHGVPPGWVECQMLLVNSRSRGPGLHVRLVIRHWDARLMTYAFAFQKELLAAITQFEPQSATWLHGLSWEFNIGDDCPYPDMPDAAVWRTPVVAAAVAATVDADAEVLQDLQDLQRMFAVRDADIGQQRATGSAVVDFQNTEPSGDPFTTPRPDAV
jgi:hypothetical protein